jgi:hypothetical protein
MKIRVGQIQETPWKESQALLSRGRVGEASAGPGAELVLGVQRGPCVRKKPAAPQAGYQATNRLLTSQ